ncbi:hypothetical protein [Hymenobacter edaphi]|uniref:Response regulatory domain-containing protein n=1 Tax=Hymenobacter edaphi TaxID=2211146 RepID=A0A328BQ39_9BACT|nr:hypothetical protein [Hymenobacter edaphi]RAK68054.1 hypothetical protein DLM85_08410 [Hymenobacter edaphi]
MYRCLLLCDAGVTPSDLLLKFIRRTGCLDLVWAGAYPDLAAAGLPAAGWDLVFASLPAPEQPVPEAWQELLRRQPALVLTSPYPARLYAGHDWQPLAFLAEPFSFDQFQRALQRYFDSGLAPEHPAGAAVARQQPGT